MQLSWSNDASGFSFVGHNDRGSVPVSEWGRLADDKLSSVLAQFYAWLESGEAIADDNVVLIDDLHVASLSERQANTLGLPPIADVVLELVNQSTLDRDDFRISAVWKRPSGQSIAAPHRQGCLLQIGKTQYRLPLSLFKLADALAQFDRIPVTEADARLAAWAKVQNELPEEAAAQIRTTGYLGGLRLYYASAVSLRLSHAGGDVNFTPVLHGAATVEEPLLPERYQSAFAEQVPKMRRARGKYALGDGQYAILSTPLTKAIEIVRQAAVADPNTRRAFARNPREALRAALGDEYSESFVENLFVETTDYSERVKEIGLWQPKVIPWVTVPKEPWLPPAQGGLVIAGRKIDLSSEQAQTLLRDVEAALAEGRSEVSADGVEVPATPETAEALRTLVGQLEPNLAQPKLPERNDLKPQVVSDDKHVLIITDNLADLGYEISFKRRAPECPIEPPKCLKTALMAHQADGLAWLQQAWQTGRTGVLLADDMGLGKTLQALTFLAWLREAMQRGQIAKAPILIVAPTGLLANWRQEHDEHLSDGGLGDCLNAYGADLANIRLHAGNELGVGSGVLDEGKIASANWVLTTYETARDYQLSFGRVPFAAIVFDEVQKIKTPGTLVTEAAKALQADFTIALTGTPIENRLADLWCIMDTVQPGYLSDLKSFSAKYEKDADQQSYQELKSRLLRAPANIPQILLRRMKEENLKGLPEKQEHVLSRVMPEVQAQLYLDAVAVGRSKSDKRSMLNTIQALRSISLHPLRASDVEATDEQYIASSARYQLLFEILDKIADKKEKALIFLEFLNDQSYLAGVIQRRYRLTNAPLLINGEVSGDRRLQRVNAFQADNSGFGAMILSPRAGGVGLTLTAANHVIHLSRWWNPAVEDQCTDRVYRIGQKKPISVYYPMALTPSADEYSFDNRLHELLMRKRTLSRQMLCPPAASEADAESLFEETVMAQPANRAAL